MIQKKLQQQQLLVEAEVPTPIIDDARWVVPSSVLKISSKGTDHEEEHLSIAMSTIKSYFDDDDDDDDETSNDDESPANKDSQQIQQAESRHAQSENERENESIPTVRSKYYEQEESQLHGGSGDSGDTDDVWKNNEPAQSNKDVAEPDAGCCSLFDSLINPLGIFQCSADTTTCVINRDNTKTRSNTLIGSEEQAFQQVDSLVQTRTKTVTTPENKNPPTEVEDERDWFMRRLAEDGMFLKDASDVHKADKEMILVAVGQNGRAIQFASPGLQLDKEVALTAIHQNVDAFYMISKDLWNDKDIMIAAVSHRYSSALNAATTSQKANLDIMSVAIKHNGHMLGMASREIQNNKQVVIDAVSDQGEALKYASDELRADKDVVCAAVKNKSNALKYALGGLNEDRDCWIAAGLVVPDQEGEVTWNMESSTKHDSKDSLDEASSLDEVLLSRSDS